MCNFSYRHPLPSLLLLPLALMAGSLACRTPLPPPSESRPDAAGRAPGETDVEVTPPALADAGPPDALTPDLAAADLTAPDLAAPEVAPPTPDAAMEVQIQVDPSACGTLRPDMSQVVGADGLVIDRAGTIYYSRSAATETGEGYVGRMRAGAPLEPTWLTIPAGSRLWGLALDESRGRLYVLAALSKTIHYVETGLPAAAAPVLKTLATALESPNDIAVGADGHVYYSAEADRNVYRLSPAGVKSVVTTSVTHARLAPAGLTFAVDGTLLVGSAGTGPILRLTLAGGKEQARRTHGHLFTWGNGLVFDRRGRLYVVTYSPTRQARVVMIVEDESTAIEVANGMGFGSLAFGRGPLDCRDLYIAVPSGQLLRLPTDAPGL